MQSRRQFLCTAVKAAAGATVTLGLAPFAIGCGSSGTSYSSSGAPSTSTNPTVPACDGAGGTSTVVLGHSHTVCAPLADLMSPPAAGKTYTTSGSVIDGHTHQLSLSMAQLSELGAGQSITVTTNVVESHTHDFSLMETVPATM